MTSTDLRFASDLTVLPTPIGNGGNVYRVSVSVTDDAEDEKSPTWYSISFLWSKNSGEKGLRAAAQKALKSAKASATDDSDVAAVIAAISTESLSVSADTKVGNDEDVALGSDAEHPIYTRVVE